MLRIAFLWLSYLTSGNLYLLTLHPFARSALSLWHPPPGSVCLCARVGSSPQMSEIVRCGIRLSLPCFTQHNGLKVIHVVASGKISYFIMFSCTNIARFLYPFIHRRTRVFLSYLVCSKCCRDDRGSACILRSYCFRFLWIYTHKRSSGSCGSSSFHFLRNLQLFFTVAALTYISTSSAQGSPFCATSPTLVISCVFDSSHPNRCAVTAHCGSDDD